MNVLFYMYATYAHEVYQLESNSSCIYFSWCAVFGCQTVELFCHTEKVDSKEVDSKSFLYRLKHFKSITVTQMCSCCCIYRFKLII